MGLSGRDREIWAFRRSITSYPWARRKDAPCRAPAVGATRRSAGPAADREWTWRLSARFRVVSRKVCKPLGRCGHHHVKEATPAAREEEKHAGDHHRGDLLARRLLRLGGHARLPERICEMNRGGTKAPTRSSSSDRAVGVESPPGQGLINRKTATGPPDQEPLAFDCGLHGGWSAFDLACPLTLINPSLVMLPEGGVGRWDRSPPLGAGW